MSAERVFLVPSGYNFRAVLAFCRALKMAGQRPAIVACTADDPIFRTSFASEVVFVRNQRELDLAEFASATARAVTSRGAIRCVLAPTSEFLIRWALRNRVALADAGCDLPLPTEDVYLRVTDKEIFTDFCRERGLPVPVELQNPRQLPCVAKPRWNLTPDGRSLYPWLLQTQHDLTKFLAEARGDEYFFQEWVEGGSFYLLFHIPQEGAAIVYSQENLLQQAGGKSIVFAQTAHLHNGSQSIRWENALRAAGFRGLVMVELRKRGDEYVLIEANPRMWGPLQLCLDGCPELLLSYIAESTGTNRFLRKIPPKPRVVKYFWSGGLIGGAEPVWHGQRPRFPLFAKMRRLGSDVYLRSDSWKHFMHERRSPNKAKDPHLPNTMPVLSR